MSEDRKELLSLRVAVARIAQALRVETDQLKVRGRPYEELYILAEFNERGWNYLAGECVEKIMDKELQNLLTGGEE
jgi:hypothetical protein